ncbi:MAG: N-acetylneuraminate synthase family protein [Brevinemataceae bacterium]
MFDINKLFSQPELSPIFFIAELGINHDGNVSTAKQMIDAALEAKADAVKFQIYNTELFYNKKYAPEAYELFETFYISIEDFLSLKKYAESRGIIAFAAPFDTQTLTFFIKEQITPIKIASGDAFTEPWIDKLLESKTPFIISTGSLEDHEIKQLANHIKGSHSAMLYCVSEYPAPSERFDINYLNTLHTYLPNQAIGFSDHSQGIALSLAATAHGAKIIERHFTLSPERTDYDHPVSLSPEEFAQMVSLSRNIEKSLGTGSRIVSNTEKTIRSLAGRDAYAANNILAGTVITEEHIILQRPGSGISSKKYHSLIGKSYNQDISQGTRLFDIFPSSFEQKTDVKKEK